MIKRTIKRSGNICNKTMENNKTYIWIAIGVIAAAVVLVIVFSRVDPKSSDSLNVPGNTDGTTGINTQNKVLEALPGISKIAGNEVITESGKPAVNDVAPGATDAPKQSVPINETNIPASAIKISASLLKGFSPSTFEVRSGSVVTLSLTSEDSESYTFTFEDSALSAVTIGIGPGQTRVTNFKAPTAGAYDFRSAVPGHAAKGLVGKMVVK